MSVMVQARAGRADLPDLPEGLTPERWSGVRGTGEVLLMAVAGRTAVADELSGPCAGRLTRRQG